MFVGPGWLDDLVILGLAYWWYSRIRRAIRSGPYQQGGPASSENKNNQQKETSQSTAMREDDPYTILGIQRNASNEEIRKANE